jgi:serine/threonine protein kinase/WD40 repeat protein
VNDTKRSEETLFEVLSQLPAPERTVALEEACGQDAALRERLETLLAAHDRASAFMAEPVAPTVPGNGGLRIPVSERLGDQIGPYKLIQQIGEGGCGVVYLAQQDKPVRRLVALKVIKLGMDTRQVVARFEAERQALALMDHPNIAKVLDAGATETGRPFFVMELVRGIMITVYCDQNQLSPTERLKLFVEVCRAVQHAHQKGIIHRDLKPSNILVTINDGVPVPKVIDFGIAKATQGRLTDMTVVTAFDQFIGTPAYVSPEQAVLTSLDIDTRSDIYSLGVLLYELLTGKTPFDTRQLLAAGLDELRRTIREQEPMRPSTRLSTMGEVDLTTVAQARHAEPARLRNLLRGDLDWIVMKCLEKDRTRRYETANGLARDVERHLRNEPVLARPPSRLYEFQKTLRRHWIGFAATATVLVALAIGTLVSTLEAVRARRAEREQTRLRLEAERAESDRAKQQTAAQQALYKYLIGEAQATRLTRRLGYRDQVFALLKQAQVLDVPERNLTDLRQKAIACASDFVGLTPTTIADFPTNADDACLAPAGNLAAFAFSDRTIQIRQLPSGKVLAHLNFTNESLQDFCFAPDGDHFFVKCGPPSGRFYGWAPDVDGVWRETHNRELPPFTPQLLCIGTGVFTISMTPLTENVSYSLKKGAADGRKFVVEYASPALGDTDSRSVKIRLLNPDTGSFAPGYDVTNAVPHSGDMSVCVSGDGRVLGVETVEHHDPNPQALVNLYEWRTGERIAQFRRSISGSLLGSGPLSLSDDGKYFINLTEAGGALYALPSLERVTQFKRPNYGWVPRMSGNWVALPDGEGIRLWNLRTSEDVVLLDEPNDDIWPVAFTADANSFLTVGMHHARLYQLNTPEKLHLPPLPAAVPGMAFSPDGLRLASVGKDRVLRVSDSLTGRTLWETNDLPGPGQCVSFSPQGQWLAVGNWDSDIVWIRDARTGQRLLELGEGRPGHGCSAKFSPDGRYLVTAGDFTNGVKIWSIEPSQPGRANGGLEAKMVKSCNVAAMGLEFAPDGQSLVFHTFLETWPADYEGGPLYLWTFEHSAQPLQLAPRILGGIQCGGFTPDARQLVAMDGNADILTLEVATGKRISSFHFEEPLLQRSEVGVQLSPDGSKVAVTLITPSGGAISILDPKTAKHLYSLPAETGSVYWLTWSPDSRRLAIARDNGNIAIWNLEEVGQVLAKLGLNP